MTERGRYDLALSFWTIAFQYLMLAENALRETVSQGNAHVIVRNFTGGPITHEELAEETRWSDHKIIIPLLFNLFHGIELLVKGFILADPDASVPKSHKIQDLCTKFTQMYPDEKTIHLFLNKYTSDERLPHILQHFLTGNGLTVDRLYQALRYPSDDFSTILAYASLKYQGEDGTPLFKEISREIKEVRVASVRLGRSLDPTKKDMSQH